ncbi:hypothetical protein PDIG_48700 [Penicillium digitatum PHI26]|uniref:Uncharacterized protein n=2 Tax=Penicillium digitatum TaxID=36651 RepID=K9GA03_PEND2|nr:hypothetical protein PDIP_58080 [Penicillium digitatum Pd1]EKV10973.1 hypothetical protein PDIP_58080 [Penicillium digitatum Pd1]EKV11738.1 hypothetical protein PDIG_48700 [Penicillium digitatum PHI26]
MIQASHITGFIFAHLQLAMRRFYYGISLGIPAEPLLYTEARTNPITDKALKPTKSQDREEIEGSQMKDLLSVDTHIYSSPPSLYLRTQELAVVRRQNLSLLLPLLKDDAMHN